MPALADLNRSLMCLNCVPFHRHTQRVSSTERNTSVRSDDSSTSVVRRLAAVLDASVPATSIWASTRSRAGPNYRDRRCPDWSRTCTTRVSSSARAKRSGWACRCSNGESAPLGGVHCARWRYRSWPICVQRHVRRSTLLCWTAPRWSTWRYCTARTPHGCRRRSAAGCPHTQPEWGRRCCLPRIPR